MIVILLGGAEWMYKQKMSKFQLLEDRSVLILQDDIPRQLHDKSECFLVNIDPLKPQYVHLRF